MSLTPWWMRRLRLFAVPIWVAIGIVVSIGVYQTLVGKEFDSQILNAPNLMSETIQHVFLSGVSFGLVAAIGVPLGVVIAQAGRARSRVPPRESRAGDSRHRTPRAPLRVPRSRRDTHRHRPGRVWTPAGAAQHRCRYSGSRPGGGRCGARDGDDTMAGFGASAIAPGIAVGLRGAAHGTRPNHRNRYTRKLHWRWRPRGRDRRRHQQQ